MLRLLITSAAVVGTSALTSTEECQVTMSPEAKARAAEYEKEACKTATDPQTPDEITCNKHVKWAMNIGFTKHPDWYTCWAWLNPSAESAFDDFQYVLYRKQVLYGTDEGHGCKWKPCHASEEATKAVDEELDLSEETTTTEAGLNDVEVTPPPTPPPTAPPTAKATVEAMDAEKKTITTTEAPKAVEPATPWWQQWWVWLLLAALLLCIGGAVYAMLAKGKAPKKEKKKKKAAALPAAAAEPPAPAPVPTTAAPLPTYTLSAPVAAPSFVAPPVTTVVAPPVYVEAAPVQYAAPAPVQYIEAQPAPVTYAAPAQVTYAAQAAPVTYAAPAPMMYAAPASVAYAAPMQSTAVANTMFDLVDQNHDGVISRGEMNNALR